jgi:hypothetical protein
MIVSGSEVVDEVAAGVTATAGAEDIVEAATCSSDDPV